MSQNEMVAKIEELNELEILMDGLKAQADAIRDDIKSEMAAQGTEELNLGKYIVRWTSVLSTRFDTKRFKEAFGEELYKAYTLLLILLEILDGSTITFLQTESG